MIQLRGIIYVAMELNGRARRCMLRSISLIVLAALFPMWRQTPIMSLTKDSKGPYYGRSTGTSHGKAGANGISFGSRTGDGMSACLSHAVDVVVWHHNGLLAISRARSVMVSMTIHHSTGLNADPNVNRR